MNRGPVRLSLPPISVALPTWSAAPAPVQPDSSSNGPAPTPDADKPLLRDAIAAAKGSQSGL